jgi:hypothetical protein
VRQVLEPIRNSGRRGEGRPAECVGCSDNDNKSDTFEVIYSALDCHPQHQLAAELGAACDENRALKVNAPSKPQFQGSTPPEMWYAA